LITEKEMSYQSDHQGFLQFLREQLDAARIEYIKAIREFDSTVKDIPSEIPQLDGTLRIQRAGQASRVAFQNYSRALKRFADFTLEGRLTDDFPTARIVHPIGIAPDYRPRAAKPDERLGARRLIEQSPRSVSLAWKKVTWRILSRADPVATGRLVIAKLHSRSRSSFSPYTVGGAVQYAGDA
jgi:hypothetical protein